MLLTKEQKNLVARWNAAKTMLDAAKKKESELRNEVVDQIFPTAEEGTRREELGAGYKLKCSQTYKRDVDEDVAKAVLKELPRGAKKKLLKTKVTLIKKGYDALDDESRGIFDDCLTMKPNKPQISIEKPSEE